MGQAPAQRFVLGHFPTPIHAWSPPGAPDGVHLFIKRDDMTGMQLSGNKVHSTPSFQCNMPDDRVNQLNTLVHRHVAPAGQEARVLGG